MARTSLWTAGQLGFRIRRGLHLLLDIGYIPSRALHTPPSVQLLAGNALRLIEFLGRVLGKAMYEGKDEGRAGFGGLVPPFLPCLLRCLEARGPCFRQQLWVEHSLRRPLGQNLTHAPRTHPSIHKHPGGAAVSDPPHPIAHTCHPTGILVELPLAPFFLKKFRGAYCDISDLPTLDPELARCVLCSGDGGVLREQSGGCSLIGLAPTCSAAGETKFTLFPATPLHHPLAATWPS